MLKRIVALFPALTLDVSSADEMGNYFVKGRIDASGTALHDDREAMERFEKSMTEAVEAAGRHQNQLQ